MELLQKAKSRVRRRRYQELGLNVRAAEWIDGVAQAQGWAPSTWTVARVLASWTSCRTWRAMRLCIDWICEKSGYSRTAVKEALKLLRSEGFLAHDGQIEVGKPRKVNKWRVTGTPEFPLPEDVIMAREEDREAEMSITPEWENCASDLVFDHTQNRGEVTATQDHAAGCGSSSSSHLPGRGLNLYPSAKPMKTGPKATTGGEARRPTHLSASPWVLRTIMEVEEEKRAGRRRALLRDLKRALKRKEGKRTQKLNESVSDAPGDSPGPFPSDRSGV